MSQIVANDDSDMIGEANEATEDTEDTEETPAPKRSRHRPPQAPLPAGLETSPVSMPLFSPVAAQAATASIDLTENTHQPTPFNDVHPAPTPALAPTGPQPRTPLVALSPEHAHLLDLVDTYKDFKDPPPLEELVHFAPVFHQNEIRKSELYSSTLHALEAAYPVLHMPAETLEFDDEKTLHNLSDGAPIPALASPALRLEFSTSINALFYTTPDSKKSIDRLYTYNGHNLSYRLLASRILRKYFTGEADGTLFLNYDAVEGRTAYKILNGRPYVHALTTPQNVFDSAHTKKDVAEGRYYQFVTYPGEETETNETNETKEASFRTTLPLSNYVFEYTNAEFGPTHPHGFRVTLHTPTPYTTEMAPHHTGGPSQAYLASCLAATLANEPLAAVTAEHSSTFAFFHAYHDAPLNPRAFLDLKRSGDRDQATAAREFARKEPTTVFVTGDSLSALYARILGLHVILDRGQSLLLYRSPVLSTALTDTERHEREQERWRKRLADAAPVFQNLDALAALFHTWEHSLDQRLQLLRGSTVPYAPYWITLWEKKADDVRRALHRATQFIERAQSLPQGAEAAFHSLLFQIDEGEWVWPLRTWITLALSNPSSTPLPRYTRIHPTMYEELAKDIHAFLAYRWEPQTPTRTLRRTRSNLSRTQDRAIELNILLDRIRSRWIQYKTAMLFPSPLDDPDLPPLSLQTTEETDLRPSIRQRQQALQTWWSSTLQQDGPAGQQGGAKETQKAQKTQQTALDRSVIRRGMLRRIGDILSTYLLGIRSDTTTPATVPQWHEMLSSLAHRSPSPFPLGDHYRSAFRNPEEPAKPNAMTIVDAMDEKAILDDEKDEIRLQEPRGSWYKEENLKPTETLDPFDERIAALLDSSDPADRLRCLIAFPQLLLDLQDHPDPDSFFYRLYGAHPLATQATWTDVESWLFGLDLPTKKKVKGGFLASCRRSERIAAAAAKALRRSTRTKKSLKR